MGSFRLLQFNMQFGQLWDSSDPDNSPVDIEATARLLNLYDGDIVILQEVEQALPGGVQKQPPDNFTYLQSKLEGYHSAFAYPPEDARELPFGIGLGIFSKYPIMNTRTINLPGAPVIFEFDGKNTTPTDRVLLVADIEIEGRIVTFLNTHLQAYFMINASSDDYPEQRNIVLKEAMAIEGPMVLAGDFNSVASEGLVAHYENAGLHTVQKDTVTWKRMPHVLDHIFYNDELILKGGTVDEVTASDHHMLVAEFKY
ncbi:MAG: endonuclease/exonuclease/phosphatase family protein [Verrucomicrobia bacterium]|nr:endonuclease/exonuclease/phosphatase family protein [Verrucomicrobiota bacterium]MDA1067536.1 endonuclease/exonuclease/phosphatase family protein [Verrucomicrobiota bacterium]